MMRMTGCQTSGGRLPGTDRSGNNYSNISEKYCQTTLFSLKCPKLIEDKVNRYTDGRIDQGCNIFGNVQYIDP